MSVRRSIHAIFVRPFGSILTFRLVRVSHTPQKLLLASECALNFSFVRSRRAFPTWVITNEWSVIDILIQIVRICSVTNRVACKPSPKMACIKPLPIELQSGLGIAFPPGEEMRVAAAGRLRTLRGIIRIQERHLSVG